MTLKRIHHPSPNFDSRDGQAVDILMLHYTGMKSGEEALARLTDPQAKVSAHYLIEEDGRLFGLVEEEHRAWHAGIASWQGATNINHRSIGIELVNPGHDWGYRSFPEPQMLCLIVLCQEILGRHAIPPERVLGHSDVAPRRKSDPGELFDWHRLSGVGIGLWPSNRPRGPVPQNEGEFLRELQVFGYDTAEDPSAAILAFQRHFHPNQLSGRYDSESANRLTALLESLDAPPSKA